MTVTMPAGVDEERPCRYASCMTKPGHVAWFSYTVEPVPGVLVAELKDTDGNVTGVAIAPDPDWEGEPGEDPEDGGEPGRPFEGWTDIGATDDRPALGHGLRYPAPAGAALVAWREALNTEGKTR